MIQLFPILVVALVLIADSTPGLVRREPPLSAPVTALAALGSLLMIVVVAGLWMHRCNRRLAQGQAPGPIIAAERMMMVARWALVAAHAVALLMLGWLAVVRDVVGDPILVDELLVIVPPLVAAAGLWALHYPIERRLREALLLRRLDVGDAVHRIPTRGQYVAQQVRMHLLLLLVPVLLILALGETTHVLFSRYGSDDWPGWVDDATTFAAGIGVFMLAPLVARYVLGVEVLRGGQVREDLEEICRRHDVSVREMLLWKTDGTMINAAVMGVLGVLRYVLVTDALVESLPREQVRAVLAHEIGHIRRHHLPWLVASLFALLLVASFVVGLPLLALDLLDVDPRSVVLWVDGVATGVAAAIALLAFGWISRRYERQADTFAVQHLSGLGVRTPSSSDDAEAVAPDGTISADAVEAMSAALSGVARLNTVDPHRKSWRHGSIAWRRAYLETIVGRPIDRLPIDRIIRRVKYAAAAVLVIGAAAGFWIPSGNAAGESAPPTQMIDAARQPAATLSRIMSVLPFTKMHGIGNDYVYVNAFEHDVPDPARLARAVADRHLGVGGDGLILIMPPSGGVDASIRMRMFNADGSEAEMCGNGVRCVCKYAHDHGLCREHPMRVQTGRGVLTLTYSCDDAGRVEEVCVDMGAPSLEAASVPVDVPASSCSAVIDVPLDAAAGADVPVGWPGRGGIDARMTCVSMGNPHAVFFCSNATEVPLDEFGPWLERHRIFPERVNVHFVEVIGPDEVVMRTWERGSGAARACGTGASAVVVAGHATGRTARSVLAHLPGGDLQLRWDESTGHVFMTGPAVEVFDGVWRI